MKLPKNYYRDSIKAELKLIKHLKDTVKKKFLLGVIGSPENKLGSKREKYYGRIFGNNYVFLKTTIKELIL